MILGRDYLKKIGVVINNANDSISINSQTSGPNIGLENEVCALANGVTI